MGWWGAGVKEDNKGVQLGPFRVGSLAILLFDVLSEGVAWGSFGEEATMGH